MRAKMLHRTALSETAILPAICPGCLAPGVRPLAIPRLGSALASLGAGNQRAGQQGLGASLKVAPYCELCAEAAERALTQRYSVAVFSVLLSASMATSAALYFGTSRPGLQFLLTLTAGVILPLALALLGRLPAPEYALYSEANSLLATRPEYAALLGTITATRPTPKGRGIYGFAALLGLLWFIGLHRFSEVSIHVLHLEEEPAAVLIDHRRGPSLRATLDERPGSGPLATTLGGRRSIELRSSDGKTLAQETITLWPNRTYILGTPPPGLCLFLERRTYGSAGDTHELKPLGRKGPLWEVKIPVDLWFAPLSSRPDLPTTGGVRHAIRLLPCVQSAGRSPETATHAP